MSERVLINVGGRRYETREATLQRFSGSLLGEPEKRQCYSQPDRGELFFDRSGSSFEGVLQYYQTAGTILRRPPAVALEVFLDDVQFYGLGAAALRRVQQEEGVLAEDGQTQAAGHDWRARLWTALEYPARALPVTLVSAIVTLVSILAFVLETLPELKEFPAEWPAYPVEGFHALAVIQVLCTVWFLLELLARLIATCPRRARLFILDPLTYVDLLAIFPYFIGVALRGTSYWVVVGLEGTGKLARVLRLFRYVRHTATARVFRQTAVSAAPALAFCLLIFCMAVVMYGSVFYWIEETDSPMESIALGMWFALVTMATVGYGDLYPRTIGGRVVSGLCAITALLVIAMLVATVVSKYMHLSQASPPAKVHQDTVFQPQLTGFNLQPVADTDAQQDTSEGHKPQTAK